MILEKTSLDLLTEALTLLENGFRNLPDLDNDSDTARMKVVLNEVAGRMQDNFPYFHPLYAGQMLKPPHPIARLAYMLSLWVNPNNHALDGGRASSQMEKEAVAHIAGMFGWQSFLGHLTGGGTMANLEALWVCGKLKPGLQIVASEQAHYTHGRISEVLGLSFRAAPCDAQARLDLQALEEILKGGKVGAVVATIGTTGTGSVDPLPELLVLRDQYGFRLHADSAYGGYFRLASNLAAETRRAYDCLDQVDSIVVDPHKHGLQPYGCGCVLFRDPAVGHFYKHDSPYTYFSSHELHLGEISLECSRPGAAAAALWATMRLLPLARGGDFAGGLEKCRQAALALYNKVAADDRWRTIFPPELDILVWAPAGDTASQISERSEAVYRRAQAHDLHLAIFKYPAHLLRPLWPEVTFDRSSVTCLRACLMKPEHLDWVERIWQILTTQAV